jgi:hypothetical protein
VALVCVVALAGLSWREQDQLRARATDAIEAAWPFVFVTPAVTSVARNRQQTLPPSPRVVTGDTAESPAESPEQAWAVDAGEIAAPPLTDTESEPIAATAAVRSDDPDAAAESGTVSGADTPGPVVAASEPPVDSVFTAPDFVFVDTAIAVAEDAGAARIQIRRLGDLSSPAGITWSTGELDALAGDDYADIQQQTERLASNEDVYTLFVPLVNDSLPEGTESFLVHLDLARVGGQELRIGRTLRVEITDND